MRRELLAAIAAFTLAATSAGFGAVLEVGPGAPYETPCAAFAAAGDGDTIEISAEGVYMGDVCAVRPNRLLIRGVGGRAKIDAAGKHAEGKAIWVIKGSDTIVENIEFTGAVVPDNNGAGIRQEGDNLTVRNCYFHHNETSILSGVSPNSEIVVEYTELGYNGHDGGFAHNIYIGHAKRFVLRFSYSHDAREGHLVKSRAAENYILYNRLTGETGTGSFELDLPNGGKSFVIGNLIEQAASTHNGRILNYQREGADPRNPSSQLYVINNTFVNNRLTGNNLFLDIDVSVAPPVVVRNNIFVGPGQLTTQSYAVFENNLIGADPGFLDAESYDYRLGSDSPALDTGEEPGEGDGEALAPWAQYVHPACGESRAARGAIDLGALEAGGAGFLAEAPERCRRIDEGGVVNAADFRAGPVAPGSIVSIFGTNLASAAGQAGAVPLPVSLGSASVTVNGLTAPLFYVSPSQINAQVPFEVGPGMASVVVDAAGVPTEAAMVEVAAAAPVLFRWGKDRALAVNSLTGELNSPQQPARMGSVVTVYLVGQGPVEPPVATGEAAPADQLARATEPYSATVGGQPATVHYLGLAPGFVGLLQANIEIPTLAGNGDYPLVITIGAAETRPGMVAVNGP